MPLHASPHPLAGRLAVIIAGAFEGEPCVVNDWYDRLSGCSVWRSADPIAFRYAFRHALRGLPIDNEVVQVSTGRSRHLLHASELVAVPAALLDATTVLPAADSARART